MSPVAGLFAGGGAAVASSMRFPLHRPGVTRASVRACAPDRRGFCSGSGMREARPFCTYIGYRCPVKLSGQDSQMAGIAVLYV